MVFPSRAATPYLKTDLQFYQLKKRLVLFCSNLSVSNQYLPRFTYLTSRSILTTLSICDIIQNRYNTAMHLIRPNLQVTHSGYSYPSTQIATEDFVCFLKRPFSLFHISYKTIIPKSYRYDHPHSNNLDLTNGRLL